jgi:hypothetical protein
MTIETAPAAPSPTPLLQRIAAPAFTLALFSSAALIFVLQPLFGRMVTPLLGGSPQVWNTSMAFFQAALLLGYLYAHLVARLKDVRLQAVIHGAVLLLAWFTLPLQVTSALGEPNSDHPALWLLGVLALSVGAPFAAASATAPLLQAWYARTGRPDAKDPYYLYAASNLGSFIGLLAYPALIEPTMGAQAQSGSWAIGYVVVAALIALCAAVATSTQGADAPPQVHTEAAPSWRKRLYWVAAAAVPSALSLGVTLHISTDVASAPMLWVIPLALYLATFVIAFGKRGDRISAWSFKLQPLAIALLVVSYYASGNWLGSMAGILIGFFFSALICHHALARARPEASRLTEFYFFVSLGGVAGGAFAALLAPMIFNNVYEYPLALAAACLFLPRSNAGADMARLRDAAAAACVTLALVIVLLLRLTPLDAVLAIGALGGACAMIAAGWSDESRPPVMRYGFLLVGATSGVFAIWLAFQRDFVFIHSVVDDAPHIAMREPFGAALIALAFLLLAFCVHGTIQRRREGEGPLGDIAMGLAIPGSLLLILLPLMGAGVNAPLVIALGVAFSAVAMLLNRGRPIVLAGLVLAAFVMIFLDDARGGRIITQHRDFFGVLRVRVLDDPTDPAVPPLRVLLHGTTLHGAQLAAPGLTRLPLTYYNPHTALGEAILGGLSTGDSSSLALIGLGAGATACLMRPTDELTVYEINPEVVRLSMRPGGAFTYVPECAPHARLELGDARLRIADAPDGAFDVIVVDAFSSDAIPAHLLTREALALYLSKTSEHGIVVLHLSNRNLALVSEAARVARDVGAPNLYRVSNKFMERYASWYGGSAASVMIVARSQETLDTLLLPSGEWRAVEAPPGRGWSDDYINLPRALWENLTGAEECVTFPDVPRCSGRAAAAP